MLTNKKALLLSLIPPVLVTLAIAYWYTKPLEGEIFLGLCQWEQIVYLATAREFIENGQWIFYPSPYAIEGNFPKVYSHLMQILLGYAWDFTGISLTKLWWISRLIFGPLMFYLGYKILKEFLEGIYLKIGFLMLLFGGGMAYFHAFFGSLVFGQSFLESWHLLEGPYDWWFTNLFRVTFYPLEIFAHVVLFSSILFFIKKRFALSAFFYFLTWWSHPITGVTITVIYLIFFIFEIFVFKDVKLSKYALFFIPIAGLFIWYYLAFIPSFPLSRDLAESFRSLANINAMHLNPFLYTSAWGIFIVTPLFLVRGKLFDSYKKRFILYWALVEFILINNDLIFPEFLIHQPMHFTRGNFFFPLLILTLLGLRKFLQSSFKARTPVILAFIFLLTIPDNLLFLHQFMTVGGDYRITEDLKLNPLRLTHAQWDTIEKLKDLEGREVILSYDMVTGVVVPVYTPHRTLLGHHDYTPYFNKKLEDSRFYFKTLDRGVLKKYNVTVVIFPEKFERLPEEGEVYHENSEHIIYKISN